MNTEEMATLRLQDRTIATLRQQLAAAEKQLADARREWDKTCLAWNDASSKSQRQWDADKKQLAAAEARVGKSTDALERLREDYLALELMLLAWRDAAWVTQQQRDTLKAWVVELKTCNQILETCSELNATEMQRYQIQSARLKSERDTLKARVKELELKLNQMLQDAEGMGPIDGAVEANDG